MVNNIEVQNIGSLIKDFEKSAEKLTRKELSKALRPGANAIRKAVRQRAPKRSGLLQESIQIKKGRGAASDPRATLMVRIANGGGREIPPSVYAYFIHTGVVNWGKTKRKHRAVTAEDVKTHGYKIQPRPFVYDAFEETVDKAAAKILDNISKHF